MKHTCALLATMLLAPLAALHAAHAPKPQAKPNIVFLLADDLGQGDLGCYGGKVVGNPGTTGVPEKQGFDLLFGCYDQTHARNYFPALLVRNSVDIPMQGGNGVHGKAGKGTAYSQAIIATETLDFIEQNQSRPFFCYVAWTLPHGDFVIPDASAFAETDNLLDGEPVRADELMKANQMWIRSLGDANRCIKANQL